MGHNPGAAILLRASAVAIVAAAAMAAPVLGPQTASASTVNTFTVSGQVKGTFTVDKASTCVAGNVSKSGRDYDIRIYLTDHGVKPTNALWAVLIGTEGTGHIVMSRSDGMTVGLTAQGGASIDDGWYAPNNKGGKGTIVLAANANSGSLNAVLEAEYGKATKQESIVGSWSCP